MRWWALLLLVACRREPQQAERSPEPAPAIAPAPIDASADASSDAPLDAVKPDAAAIDPDDLSACEHGTAWPLTSRGASGTIELVTCDVGTEASSDDARDQGFVTHNMEAWLVWTPAAGAAVRTRMGAWTNGWEWGESLTLEGVLVARSGASVILVQHGSYEPSPGVEQGATSLTAWKRTGATWSALATWRAATMTVTIADDRRTARVEACVLAERGVPADSCGGFEDAATVPPYELAYTGTNVVRRRLAP